MAPKLRVLLARIIIPASALAVGNQVRHMDMPNTAIQDPNWVELMKSMQTMRLAMDAVKPSGNGDVDFANLMLPHHRAAVDMARAELLYGSDPQMRRLAQEITADQVGPERTPSKERQTTSQKEQ